MGFFGGHNKSTTSTKTTTSAPVSQTADQELGEASRGLSFPITGGSAAGDAVSSTSLSVNMRDPFSDSESSITGESVGSQNVWGDSNIMAGDWGIINIHGDPTIGGEASRVEVSGGMTGDLSTAQSQEKRQAGPPFKLSNKTLLYLGILALVVFLATRKEGKK